MSDARFVFIRSVVDVPTMAGKLEEEESERQSDEFRKAVLKGKCEKKGLNFEEEEEKYQEAVAKKKAEAEAKKAVAEKAKADKLAAMTVEQKNMLAEKEKKQAEIDAKVLEEFNELRKKNSRPILES